MHILETERLLLRRLVPADLDALFALYSDPEMRQYYPEGTLSYEATREELEWFLNGHPRHPELGLWATIYKPTGQFIGRNGLLPWTIDGRDEVEVAYMIDKAFWGQGLAAEVASALVQHGFTRLGLSRLICMVDPRNQASMAVARRIGMRLEREAEDEHGPYLLFSLARAEPVLVEDAGLAVVEGAQGQAFLAEGEDGLRLIEACWSGGASAALLYAENLPPGFFDLSTRVAGTLLQKLQNYRIRLAVVAAPGNTSFSSRFHELMAEEQGGRDFAMFTTREAARAWLAG